MFSVFASKDRRANYELLLFMMLLHAEPFEEKMARLTSELSDLFDKSHELEAEIRKNLGAIGYEI